MTLQQAMILDEFGYELQSEFMRNLVKKGYEQGFKEGFEQGRAQVCTEVFLRLVCKVLDARGLHLSEEQAHRLDSCRDPETLEAWLVRAAVTTDVNDIFRPT